MNTSVITTWEYLIVKDPTPRQLAGLGQQGWELVQVVPSTFWLWRTEKAFFKRPSPVPPLLASK